LIESDRGEIEKETLTRIKPPHKTAREVEQSADSLLKRAKKILSEMKGQFPGEVRTEIVGSVAKGTYLKHQVDIDLFLLFPQETPQSKLKETGLELGKKILDSWEMRYAEHPYVHGKFQKFEADVVPCYGISSPTRIISSVDRTPFHTKYINEHLSPEQKDEVRLLKQFFIGIGIYGAEAELNGFSGYLCELLVCKFKSFRGVLENIQELEEGKILTLNATPEKIFDSPLVFIDPVDPKRNAGAAVSKESLERLKKASEAYLRRPSLKFFFPNPRKKLTRKEIEKKLSPTAQMVGYETIVPDLDEEKLIPQIKKSERNARILLEKKGFVCRGSTHAIIPGGTVKKAAIIFLLDPAKAEKSYLHAGPRVEDKANAKKFLQKWEGSPMAVGFPQKHKGRWVVKVKRRYTDAEELLRDALMGTKQGKHIKIKMEKFGFRILNQKELLGPEYRESISKLVDPKLPWEC
jgi:tRNA nucleotidyltransferase (CCA-adding enzyme)